MSDPTPLWVLDPEPVDCGHETCERNAYDEARQYVIPASRGDILAALPNKKWWCVFGWMEDMPHCKPDDFIRATAHHACHWAVPVEAADE